MAASETPVTIFVKGLRNNTLSFEMSHDEFLAMKVADFKLRIRDKERIPLEQQRLVYAGKELHDKALVTEYNIQNESTLFLVARLLGGSFINEGGRVLVPSIMISLVMNEFAKATVGLLKSSMSITPPAPN
eukprot:TRINITY_DN25651_c0_g1_i1.p1 TRINITY_DN25651_c0_g1~~TRINITY_DN25651_c0_g1_i1.p1  ORF type:complete len:145 (+),score=17.36 TRINITY_DN25651_c0_g1_i1:45-437(+)